MNVSIVVTCYDEEINMRECLNTLIRQTYPADKFEVVISDGGSKDNTQDIVREFTKSYSNVHLVVEHKKGTAAGRNAGVKAARYDYIAFIDADCEAPSDWLETLVRDYKKVIEKDKDIVAIGGTNIPPDNASKFLMAVGIAQDSFIGSFHAYGRQFKKNRYVSTLPTLNILYDKRKIIEIGCFDESLQSEAEDADLNFRLFSAGYKFLFVSDSFVWHKMRPTSKAWFKNMFRYGKGRARLLKRYPQMWKLPFALPVIFIAAMFSTLFIPFSNVFLLPLLYFPLLICFSLFQCLKKKSPALILLVMFVYLIQHFGYAVGEVYGLVNPGVK